MDPLEVRSAREMIPVNLSFSYHREEKLPACMGKSPLRYHRVIATFEAAIYSIGAGGIAKATHCEKRGKTAPGK